MKAVLRAAITAALLAGTGIVHSAPARQPSDCELKPAGTIELLVGEDGNLLVPIAFHARNGEIHDGLMVLDTSAAYTVIWRSVVAEARLPVRDLSRRLVVSFGNTFITRYTPLESLVLGDVDLGRTSLLIGAPPLTPAPSLSPLAPVVGTLGTDVFRRFDFELDLSRRKIRLFAQNPCPGHGAYWTNDFTTTPLHRADWGHLSFPMKLDGATVEVTASPTVKTTGVASDGVPVELGRDALETLRIYFATKANLVYYSDEDAAK
jgi:hypothetical protein